MQIRMAQQCDIEGISNLLLQICNVHHEGRPDLFKKDGKKYSPEQLKEIINDEKRLFWQLLMNRIMFWGMRYVL